MAASIDDKIYTKDFSRLIIDPVYHVGVKEEGEYAGKGAIIG